MVTKHTVLSSVQQKSLTYVLFQRSKPNGFVSFLWVQIKLRVDNVRVIALTVSQPAHVHTVYLKLVCEVRDEGMRGEVED